MRKNVWKRCLAFVLSAVVMFTSVDVSWAATKLDAAGSFTTTLGEIVAEKYGLSDEEEAVLASANIAGNDSITFLAPTADEDLVAVDAETKTITAEVFMDAEGNEWKPVKAIVSYEEEGAPQTEECAITAGTCNFEYEGNTYSVAVTYEVGVTIDQNEQHRLLNAPYYLGKGVEALNTILEDNRGSLDNIAEALPVLESSVVDKLAELGKTLKESTVKAIDALNDEFQLYGWANEFSTSSQAEFYVNNGASLRSAVSVEQPYIETIGADADLAEIANTLKTTPGYETDGVLLSAALSTFKIYARKIDKYTDLEHDSWEGLDYDLVENWDKKDTFESLVADVFNEIYDEKVNGPKPADENTEIVVCTTDVACNVNRYNVKVTLSADVLAGNPDDDKLVNDGQGFEFEKTITLNGGLTEAEVTAAVQDVVDAQVGAWNAEYTSANIGEANYVYELVAPQFDENVGLNADCGYTATYVPKNYTVIVNGVDSTVPYGYVLTLPKHSDETQGYEYTIDGISYYQGDPYRVIGDKTINGVTGKARQKKTINEIVADSNGLTGTEAEILKSPALKSNGEITAQVPASSDITLNAEGTVLTVNPWTDKFNNTWEPREVELKDGSDNTIGEKITSFPNNEVNISVNYDKVNALYSLEIERDDALAILNTPYDLSEEVEGQMRGMQRIVDNKSQLEQVKKGTIAGVITLLETYANEDPNCDDSERQIALDLIDVFTEMVDTAFNGTTLKLLDYANAYDEQKQLADSGEADVTAPLTYYYANVGAPDAGGIAAAYANLKDMLDYVVTDEKMAVLREATGMTSELDMLQDAKNTLDSMGNVEHFLTPMNEKILDNSSKTELLAKLIDFDGSEHAASATLYWDALLTKTAPNKYLVTYYAQRLDEEGNVVATSEIKSFTKLLSDKIDSDDISTVSSGISALAGTIVGGAEHITKNHYVLADELYYKGTDVANGTLIEAGTIEDLTENVVVVYNYEPAYYYVNVDGNEQEIRYGNTTVKLPAPTTAAFKYVYKISDSVSVTVDSTVAEGAHTFTDIQLDTLFELRNDKLILNVTKEVINVAQEELGSLFGTESKTSAINDEFYEKGMKEDVNLTSAVIPYKNSDNEIVAAALRVFATGETAGVKDVTANMMANVVNSVMAMVEPMALQYPYIGLGGNALYDNGVSLDAAISAILASGIGSESIGAMFDENGNIVDNAKLAGYTVAAVKESGNYKIPNTDKLGALVIKTTLELGESASDCTSLEFVITFDDLMETSDELAARKKVNYALDKFNKVADIRGVKIKSRARSLAADREELQVTFKTPYSKEAYEVYLVAMIAEGRTDFANIENVKLKDIINYEYDRVVPVLKEDDVTATTLQNTLDKLGVTREIDNETLQTVLNIFKNDFAYVDGNGSKLASFTRYTDANNTVEDNAYYFSADVESSKKLIGKFNIPEEAAKLLKDEAINVPVKVIVNGVGEEYAAAVVNDPRTLENITGVNMESAKIAANVINLLTKEDLAKDTIAPNAMVIMLTGDATDTVKLAGNAIVNLNGKDIKAIDSVNGTVVLVDGTYNNDGDVTDALPTNVKDARLNGFYKFNELTDGTVEVIIDADFLEEAVEVDKSGLKYLATELVFDLVMNNITSGSVKLTNNETGKEFNLYDAKDVEDADDIFAFVDANKSKQTLVNTMIDIVKLGDSSNPGLVAFVNEMIAALTDFAAIRDALASDNVIAEYTATTKPLNAEFAHNAAGDYLTAGITTDGNAPKNFVIKVKVADDDSELLALSTKLAEIVKECEITVGLTNIDYVNGNIAANGQSITADVKVDLTGDKNYAVALATILANGMTSADEADEKAALVKAIKGYLTVGNNDSMLALKDAMEKVTTAQMINAVKAAYANYNADKDFDAMLASLGITESTDAVKALEDVYEDLLNVLYRIATLVSNKFGIVGNDKELGEVAYFVDDGELKVYGYGTQDFDYNTEVKGVPVEVQLDLLIFKDIVDPTPGPSNPSNPSGGSSSSDKDDKDEPEYVGTYTPPTSGSTGASTGDANNTTLWIALMGLAIVAVVVAYTKKKRKAE